MYVLKFVRLRDENPSELFHKFVSPRVWGHFGGGQSVFGFLFVVFFFCSGELIFLSLRGFRRRLCRACGLVAFDTHEDPRDLEAHEVLWF